MSRGHNRRGKCRPCSQTPLRRDNANLQTKQLRRPFSSSQRGNWRTCFSSERGSDRRIDVIVTRNIRYYFELIQRFPPMQLQSSVPEYSREAGTLSLSRSRHLLANPGFSTAQLIRTSHAESGELVDTLGAGVTCPLQSLCRRSSAKRRPRARGSSRILSNTSQ